MIRKTINCDYDTAIFPTDWRFSAAIIGLKKYFDYFKIPYSIKKVDSDNLWLDISDDLWGFEGLFYNREQIDKERYLLFVENFYGNRFQHIDIKEKIKKEGISTDEIKAINDLMTGSKSNKVLQTKFKGVKFDGTNEEEILDIITENEIEIIEKTFINKEDMYRNYANNNLFFTNENPHCRLKGFNLDENKKSKSAAYSFDKNTFISNDCIEFDFIPMAFSKSYTSVFVNNNFSIELLLKTYDDVNNVLDKEMGNDVESTILQLLANSAEYAMCDVEVIMKDRNQKYYTTGYIRQNSIDAMRKMKNVINKLKFKFEIGKNYWFDTQKEVTNACINGIALDNVIEILLKKKEDKDVNRYCLENVINKVIQFDLYMKGEGVMEKNENKDVEKETEEKKWTMERYLKNAIYCAREIAEVLPENKIKSYRQKLISAVVFHDYDRACEILLQLSGFSGVSMPFAYKIYENPEKNKNIIYSFANGLDKNNVNNNKKTDK